MSNDNNGFSQRIEAPWNKDQIEALNHWQRAGKFHPFTCGNRNRMTHPFEEQYGDFGVLRATRDGWKCPYCDYTQTWAHAFMAAQP